MKHTPRYNISNGYWCQNVFYKHLLLYKPLLRTCSLRIVLFLSHHYENGTKKYIPSQLKLLSLRKTQWYWHMLNNPVFQTTFPTNLRQQRTILHWQHKSFFHKDSLTFQFVQCIVFTRYTNKIHIHSHYHTSCKNIPHHPTTTYFSTDFTAIQR
jgi:hypothetical protein